MQNMIKYGFLAISIGLIELGVYYQLFGSYNFTSIIGCMILGVVMAYVIKQVYENQETNTEENQETSTDENQKISTDENIEDIENSDMWITLQTIMITDPPDEHGVHFNLVTNPPVKEYYGRRFNLVTGEILTKGDPKSEWIVVNYLKDDELQRLLEFAKKIKPYIVTDDNIVKTRADCSSDKYSLLITLKKNNKMSVLKSIMSKTMFTTNNKDCEQLVALVEKMDHEKPYWHSLYKWN